MQPHQVGYDRFHSFLSVVSEYTKYIGSRKYGQLMLAPDRLAVFKRLSEHNEVVEGIKGEPLGTVYPLDTPERMGNVDQDFAAWSKAFIQRAADDNKPF